MTTITIDAQDRAEQLLDSSECNQQDEIEQDDLTVEQINPVLALARKLLDANLNDSSGVKPSTGPVTTSRYVNENADDAPYAQNEASDKSDDDDKRDILHVGDGNFTFTLAYISFIEAVLLQSDIARRIVATELKSESELFADSEVRLTIELLREKGVIILFEVNALQLDDDARLKKYRFRCIRWNNPCFGGTTFSAPHTKLKKIMPQFYSCAAKMLSPGGILIVTIEQSEEVKPRPVQYEYKQVLVSLVSATTRFGFLLLHKNQRFNKMYIPFGYKHRMTSKAHSRDVYGLVDRTEFVFELKWDQGVINQSVTETRELFNQLYKPPPEIYEQPSVKNMLDRRYKLVACLPQVVSSLPYPVTSKTQFDLLFDYQEAPFPKAKSAADYYDSQTGHHESENADFDGDYFDRDYAFRMSLHVPVNLSLNKPSLTSVPCYFRV